MECGRQVTALFHQHGVAAVPDQHMGGGPHAADDGSADEYGLELARRGTPLEIQPGIDFRHAAVDLAAISVAFDSEIHQAQARLRGMCHFAGQQDCPGATSIYRLVLAETLERFG